MMATPLAKEWQTFTQEDPNPPDLKALQKFVTVRKTIASAAIPVAPNNKFDKAEKVNKPKQNPCPKKNSLRIARTSKTAESQTIDIHFRDLPAFQELTLADPEYSSQCRVDILLGSPQLGRCLLSGMKVSSDQNCMALNSIFGWIVGGSPGENEINS